MDLHQLKVLVSLLLEGVNTPQVLPGYNHIVNLLYLIIKLIRENNKVSQIN